MMRPRFLNLHPQLISLLCSCVLMGQTASGHFGIERGGSFFKQIFAVARNVDEFFITQARVLLVKARVQGQLSLLRERQV
jgi:hypothetical protein